MWWCTKKVRKQTLIGKCKCRVTRTDVAMTSLRGGSFDQLKTVGCRFLAEGNEQGFGFAEDFAEIQVHGETAVRRVIVSN